MNAIKKALLDPYVEDTILSDPLQEPPNEIDKDLDDIQVKPTYPKPTSKPIKVTTPRVSTIAPTTKRPTTAVSTEVKDGYKVVCYYTNWAWYRLVSL